MNLAGLSISRGTFFLGLTIVLTTWIPKLGLQNPVRYFTHRFDRIDAESFDLLAQFFYYGDGLNFLFRIVFFGQSSLRVENDQFGGDFVEYSWFVVVNCVLIWVINAVKERLLGLYGPTNYSMALLFALLSYWAFKNPHQPVQFFGIQLQAIYYPAVALIIEFVQVPNFMSLLVSATGILAAQIYIYLPYIMGQSNAPAWYRDLIEPNNSPKRSNPKPPTAGTQTNANTQFSWGRGGRRLGS